MNLPKGSLKVILKTAGWLLAAYAIIVVANWPESSYWFNSQATEKLRLQILDQHRTSNPPFADESPIPQAQREQTEDYLMFQAARQCQSDEDLKRPECVTALNAYRMKAAQRILAEREIYGTPPAPMRSGSSSYFPSPQPPPRDQGYYLQDGTRVQESPGGMRQITPPNKSALPTRRSR
ncbi:MAG: hypothetical protein KJZ79_16670 [Bryobacteraceae bacterium]|nr:hypothetical protein [Bryobacteraceae bacterium]